MLFSCWLFDQPRVTCRMDDAPLLPQDFLDLADLFLRLAGYLLGSSFGFQIRLIADSSCHFLDLAFYLMNRSLYLIPYARFHDMYPRYRFV